MGKAGKLLITLLIVATVLALTAYLFRNNLRQWFFKPTESNLQSGVATINELEEPDALRQIAQNLSIPWSIEFLPDGDLLVTERTGNLLRIGNNGQTFPISGVVTEGEGGLLGVALHPDFTDNNYVYLYSTTREEDGLKNRIERYELQNNELSNRTSIINGIPGASYHDGGELAFGLDGKLYAGTGDAGVTELAQDTSSLAGKILRLNDDGTIPNDNPFNNPVYSYGHRNVQGFTWDDEGNMWATEHGPSGVQSGYDELNLIEPGNNYGWPLVRGDDTGEGLIPPIAHSGSDETWAPGGIAYADGSLYFMGLRGSRIYQADIKSQGSVELTTHFADEFGRLRATSVRENTLYFSTSNTDGRGTPQENDDKIYAVPLKVFN